MASEKTETQAAQAEPVKPEMRPATYHLLDDFGIYKNSLRRKLGCDDLEYHYNRDGKNPEVARLPELLNEHKGFQYVLPDIELLAKYLIYTWEDDLVLRNGTLADGKTKAPNIRKHFAKLCLADFERVQKLIAKFKANPRPDVAVEVRPAKKAPKAKPEPVSAKAKKPTKFNIPDSVKQAAMQYADANVQWKSRRFGKLVRTIKAEMTQDYPAVLDYMGIVPPSDPPIKPDPTKREDVTNLTEMASFFPDAK